MLWILLNVVLGFVGFVILYLIVAWLMAVIPYNRNFKETVGGVPIYLVSNGVHMDLAIPLATACKDWSTFLDTSTFEPPKSKFEYISFGWGDKGFFMDTPTWADLKFMTAFRAAFWLSESAMHVALLEQAPTLSEKVKLVYVSETQYAALVDYIMSSFAMLNGRVERVDRESYYPHMNDNFYEGIGRYNLFKTCNNWANRGLKKTGIRTAIWAPFDKSILYHHRK